MKFLTPKGYVQDSDLNVGDELCAFDMEGNPVVNEVLKIDLRYDDGYIEASKKTELVYLPGLDEDGKQVVDITKDPIVVEERAFSYFLINGVLKLFRDQSIWLVRGPNSASAVHVEDLKVGDTLWDENDKEVEIVSIEDAIPEKVWYCLEVSGNHGAIADGFAVHNASRYWVGGGASADWDATGNTNWGSASNTQDNSSVPGLSDNAYFDGVGTGNSACTMKAATVYMLDCTGYTNTITDAGYTFSVLGAGSFILSAGMTWNYPLLIFNDQTSGTTNIYQNGHVLSAVSFTAAGATYNLTENTTLNGVTILTQTKGVVNTNGYTLTCGGIDCSGTQTRTFNATNSVITVTGRFTAVNFSGSNQTVTMTGSTLKFTNTLGMTLNLGSQTFGTVEFSPGANSPTYTINGSNTYAVLKNSATAAIALKFDNGSTQTLSAASGWQVNGTAGKLVTFTSVTAGTAWNLSCASGTVTGSYLSLKDSHAAGGATFDASDGTNVDVSGNTGWVFTATTNTNFLVMF